MRQNRAQVIAWIGMSEGGFTDHPRDPGGRTNRGITQRTYNAWLRTKGRAARDVLHITKSEADTIVSEQYMDPVRFDQLPAGLDYAVADFSVNSGPARAAKELQRLLGMSGPQVDGIIGDQTLAAIARADLESLIIGYNKARMRFLRGLKTWDTFEVGWTARVMGSQDGFQADDIGVIDRAVMMARGKSNIPDPADHKTPKANESQVSGRVVLDKVLAEPTAYIPAIGALGGLMSGDGPVQYALAAVVVVGVLLLGFRLIKRSL